MLQKTNIILFEMKKTQKMHCYNFLGSKDSRKLHKGSCDFEKLRHIYKHYFQKKSSIYENSHMWWNILDLTLVGSNCAEHVSELRYLLQETVNTFKTLSSKRALIK